MPARVLLFPWEVGRSQGQRWGRHCPGLNKRRPRWKSKAASCASPKKALTISLKPLYTSVYDAFPPSVSGYLRGLYPCHRKPALQFRNHSMRILRVLCPTPFSRCGSGCFRRRFQRCFHVQSRRGRMSVRRRWQSLHRRSLRWKRHLYSSSQVSRKRMPPIER